MFFKPAIFLSSKHLHVTSFIQLRQWREQNVECRLCGFLGNGKGVLGRRVGSFSFILENTCFLNTIEYGVGLDLGTCHRMCKV